jgi:hypothetical protein
MPPSETRPRHLLQPLGDEEAGSTLMLNGPGPFFVGEPIGSTDLVCGHCRNYVLAMGVHLNQFFAVDFLCPDCSGRSRSQGLGRGDPLPQNAIVLAACRFPVQGPIKLPPQVAFAGESAVTQRITESGWTGLLPAPSAPEKFDYEGLRKQIKRLESLLGPVFNHIMKQRGSILHQPESKRVWPRLVGVINGTLQTLEDEGDERPRFFLSEIIELSALLGSLERWAASPLRARILKDLGSDEGYYHSLFLLLAASYLTDSGNQVGFYEDREQGKRVPDLWTQANAVDRMDAELKAPRILMRPPHGSPPLRPQEALKAIESARKKALKGGHPQLSVSNPGILIIAGAYLSPSDLDLLAEESRRVLSAKGARYGAFAGILILSFNLMSGKFLLGFQTPFDPWHLPVGGGVVPRLARNPCYMGPLAIVTPPGSE